MKRIAIAVVLWLACSTAAGQVYVENYRGITHGGEVLDTDDEVVDHAYQLAFAATLDGNGYPAKTSTLYFAERVYKFHGRAGGNVRKNWRGNVWPASVGKGPRSTRFVFHGCRSDDICVYMNRGYGGGFSGIDIRTATAKAARNVVALYLDSVSSFTVDQFDATLHTTLGADSHGLVIGKAAGSHNTESVSIMHANIRAHHPINILSGDNITLRNLDLNCRGNVAPIQGRACDNLVIESVTGQRGRHAIYFVNASANRTFSGLTVRNYRWEQGTRHGGAAWIVKFSRPGNPALFGIDFVSVRDCRNAPGRQTYSRDFSGVRRVTVSGGFLPGVPIVSEVPR